MKKMILTGALIVGTSLSLATTTFAQSASMDRGYHHGIRSHEFNRGPATSDVNRGGPGPRVQGGSGAGAGAER